MKFEQFKQTARYNAFTNPMRLASFLVLEDPGYKGLTFQDITQKLKGDLTDMEISNSLDVLFDIFEIDEVHEIRGDFFVTVYKLDQILLGEPLKEFMCFG